MIAIVKGTGPQAEGVDWFYGPQGKRYTIVGELPTGEVLGVSEVSAIELATIASPVHADEYVADSWGALARSQYAKAVDWVVDVEGEGGETVQAAERGADASKVRKTSAGNPVRRPPVPVGNAPDPDDLSGEIPPARPADVGRLEVQYVEGGPDRVFVGVTDAAGAPEWREIPPPAA